MDTQCQTVQTEQRDLYLMIVYSPYVSYAETVCFFTDYERALDEQTKLQVKIDAYQQKEKEYWKGRVWFPEPPPVYGNPTVEIVKLVYADIDKVNPKYADVVQNVKNNKSLDSCPSTGTGCWFDFLKDQKKVFDDKVGTVVETEPSDNDDNVATKGIQTMFPAFYLVIDYILEDHYRKSQVVGIFSDPQLAHSVQGKVLASYGMDIVFSTIGDEHYVSLNAFMSDKCFDPETPYYKWS
jgi:hypothetical protein